MKHLNLSEPLYDYLLNISLREHPVLRALREETATMALAIMQIPPEQAQFMQLLLCLLKAKKVLEIGTFTGYSALAMALALPEDGLVVTCDINKEWTARTAHFWTLAEQEKKIDLRLAPAINTMNQLISEGQEQTYDFIFIDADKTNYLTYYELSLQLLKPGGLIAIDNVFWEGAVIDPSNTDAQTREIRKLNEFIKTDSRVKVSLLPIADGLMLVFPIEQQPSAR